MVPEALASRKGVTGTERKPTRMGSLEREAFVCMCMHVCMHVCIPGKCLHAPCSAFTALSANICRQIWRGAVKASKLSGADADGNVFTRVTMAPTCVACDARQCYLPGWPLLARWSRANLFKFKFK